MDKPENKTVRAALSSRCIYLCVVNLFEDDFKKSQVKVLNLRLV